MKKIINTILGAAALLALFNACKEETIPLYSGVKSGLFIQEVYTTVNGNPYSYQDSTSFSFSTIDEKYTSQTLRFTVRTMGDVVDYERPYKVQVIADGTTAKEGEDFDLSDNTFTIQPGTSTDYVRVKLLRTPKLLKNTLRLKLGILPNEHFELPIEEYKNAPSWEVIDAPMNSATSFLIKFSEIYTRPSYWGYYGATYWGDFTPKRFMELNRVMGWKASDWSYAGMTGYPVQLGRFDYAARALQRHLQQMADEGNPVREDDGTLMQLPAKYAVDYSKYMDE